MQRAVAASKSGKEEEYDEILHLAITVIETSRLHIAKQLNSVTMSSYWEIGKLLYERKVESKHGESIIKRLATDLKSKYPDMGLSPRNLWDMKRFYLRYCKNDKKVRQAVAVLPWSHNLLLMGYDLNPEHILFYANEVVCKGWSREMLRHALKTGYHISLHTTEKSNNFTATLPAQQADYANEVFKSTYNLGFIDAVSSLFDETFIVFEIDSIKDDPLLFPLVTLIIMDVFLQKMRIKKNRKVLVIEEAWKAIASPLMAEYIKYLYKTARKFWASVGVVTQEIQDIIGSEIVKEAIINNSDVVMLLDQSKFRERFDGIKSILGLTDVDCKKIFTVNRLENKEGRSFFREVFIRRGQVSGVYGVEEPRECYMTYTTERAEKEALKLYKSELGCNHQQAIEAYCRDWKLSGIDKSLPFAQKVNQTGHVLNLKSKN